MVLWSGRRRVFQPRCCLPAPQIKADHLCTSSISHPFAPPPFLIIDHHDVPASAIMGRIFINTETIKLEQVTKQNRGFLRYAILSHTWGDEEVTFQEMQSGDPPTWKEGYRKIVGTCKFALESGIRYAWVDTCCIDKSSSPSCPKPSTPCSVGINKPTSATPTFPTCPEISMNPTNSSTAAGLRGAGLYRNSSPLGRPTFTAAPGT